jgi:hypothetical protein
LRIRAIVPAVCLTYYSCGYITALGEHSGFAAAAAADCNLPR